MQNPYEKYRQQSVMTMTQGDMISLLYSELGDRLGKGLICLENKDYEGCNTAFKKAQEILTHLTATLDRKRRWPISWRHCMISLNTRSYSPTSGRKPGR